MSIVLFILALLAGFSIAASWESLPGWGQVGGIVIVVALWGLGLADWRWGWKGMGTAASSDLQDDGPRNPEAR